MHYITLVEIISYWWYNYYHENDATIKEKSCTGQNQNDDKSLQVNKFSDVHQGMKNDQKQQKSNQFLIRYRKQHN